ncbi:stonustoxin subunit beta-like [Trematomus bernacchii]|uniref:stonustoxin subunit beta-like n=1 Tax=Trematomus bernacchii TaxID=40690 RepID=UPI00146CB7D3|nr:stonustoxin subunit beta-like [Trematomus bernacchii]
MATVTPQRTLVFEIQKRLSGLSGSQLLAVASAISDGSETSNIDELSEPELYDLIIDHIRSKKLRVLEDEGMVQLLLLDDMLSDLLAKDTREVGASQAAFLERGDCKTHQQGGSTPSHLDTDHPDKHPTTPTTDIPTQPLNMNRDIHILPAPMGRDPGMPASNLTTSASAKSPTTGVGSAPRGRVGEMNVAALGRPFTLGMLYDARRDKLVQGLKLWNAETLKVKTSETPQQSSTFEISASDSIESNSTLMDIEASLKASFLSGMIEVGGSAKYLNDQKKFKNQSRVTFQYKATTKFKQLSIDHVTLDTEKMEVIEKGLATHVVTGILYGANAFFVFDSEKLEASQVQDIQGSMQAVIKKIPSFDVEAKVGIKLTDEEKALTNKFSCKFYGDFILKSNPATFQEAVKTYSQLPQLLGAKGKNSVPLKVWLMPLKNFDPKAAELMTEISIGLVGKAQVALEDLKEIQMRCNDSLEDKVVESFPVPHEELSTFQRLCGHYKTSLQQTMAEKLTLIRAGKEDESSLVQVFEDMHQSPFSHEKLNKWLENKEREINIIRSCVDTMEGVKIVLNQTELDREVLDSDVDGVLCFVFTSMLKGDIYLDEMAGDFKSPKLGSTHEDQWYYSDDVLNTMREKAKTFQGSAKALKNNSKFRFLIMATNNDNYKGATIYHYKNHSLHTQDFSLITLFNVETVTDKRDLIWYACDLTLDPDTANNRLTLSQENKKATYGKDQKYPSHPERFECPQVLCKEELSGHHYWEVEWSNGTNESVHVAVAYKGLGRKGNKQSDFGDNLESWSVGKCFS